ncbi:AAA family ATPase [Meiothermus sp.]|uniref:AAA family ATPase n=1 Tax=Meiothermus sp. TaxID=1955249 RepID=UPI00307E316A
MGSRLLDARRRRFVGREAERELLRAALKEAELPFALLHVYGPGGVGKTTLLVEFARTAGEEGVGVVQLDARNIDPSPDGFLFALRQGLVLDTTTSPLEFLSQQSRSLLILDTYENLTPLDGWLRETFLPQLPESTLVVLAGRNPPSAAWRSDPGWRDLIRTLSLRNLRPEESREYLSRRGVPEDKHQAVLDFTHGHPLALSLVADVLEQRSGEWGFNPDNQPDVVKALLDRFVQEVPSLTHRQALEACALVRVTTESLLAECLGLENAHEYFEWLRKLSFIQSGPIGIVPHDLAREALEADLRWRNPDWNAELHRRARGYYTRRLQETRGLEQQRILFDDVYLHRHNPMVKPFLEWGETGSVFAERGKPEDYPAVLQMIERHEGAEAAKIAARWLELQPEGLTLYRGVGAEPAGFMLMLGLHKASPADLDTDPVAQSMVEYARRYGPVRPGEEITLFRFWMAEDTYQSVSPVQSVAFLNAAQHYISSPRLAWSFFPISQPEFWLPAFTYMDLHHASEADYTVGQHRIGVFAHDWRRQPVAAWLEMLGERELATELDPAQLQVSRPAPLVVLSQPEFEEAVKNALRDFVRPDALAYSPLLRSRLLPEPTPKALRSALWEAAQTLKASPKDEKLYRALERTYLEPAATQELAAESLNLPFSTYRRHLVGAVERVVELLWQRELSG